MVNRIGLEMLRQVHPWALGSTLDRPACSMRCGLNTMVSADGLHWVQSKSSPLAERTNLQPVNGNTFAILVKIHAPGFAPRQAGNALEA